MATPRIDNVVVLAHVSLTGLVMTDGSVIVLGPNDGEAEHFKRGTHSWCDIACSNTAEVTKLKL